MRKREEIRRKWQQIVDLYERAGLSQAAFAASQKVREPALRYWIYKLRGEARGRRPESSSVRLLPVEVAGVVGSAAPPIEVRIGGLSISLPGSMTAAYVAELASALQASRC